MTTRSSGMVVSVINIVPPTAIAMRTTRAPAQLSVLRSGSPMIAPNQPPACDIASTLATILSAPFIRCRSPRMASTTMIQPIVRRRRCSTLRRRTMATPIPTTTTGRAKRPRPSNQPKVVSMASPSGPAICRYIDRTKRTPRLMRPTPQNSTSRPRTISRAAESAGADLAAGRLLPFGGVFTALRDPDDPLGPRDEELEPLADMKKGYQWGEHPFGIPRY